MIKYAPFCEKQVNYLKRCYDNWLNVAEGGKRAGKNVLNIMAWCEILETHPDKLHLASGVSVASAKLNIIDSNGFGVKHWFKGRCREGMYQQREALYIYTRTGEKVILISGGGKEGDERYIKGNTYGSAYVTEANECCKTFVKETFDRTLSSADRKIFIDLNPKAPNNWFYVEILELHLGNALKHADYGLNYEHFTLLDNFSFTVAKIKEILITYDKHSIWYKRDILGLRQNAEGVIYDMFADDNLYNDGEGVNYDLWYERYYALDYGTTNPCVFLEIIKQDGKYYLENEYYYDSKAKSRQKDDAEYADDLLKFIDGKRYTSVIVDPSAASFKVAARKKGIKIRDADNEVLDGIRLVSSLFALKLLKVNRKCINIIKEIAGYIWDAKAAERGDEKPIKVGDHACDALRYFCKTIIRVIRG